MRNYILIQGENIIKVSSTTEESMNIQSTLFAIAIQENQAWHSLQPAEEQECWRAVEFHWSSVIRCSL